MSVSRPHASASKLHSHTLAVHSPGLQRRLDSASASDGESREGSSRSRRAQSIASDPPLLALNGVSISSIPAASPTLRAQQSDSETMRPRRSPLVAPLSSHHTYITPMYSDQYAEVEDSASAMQPLLLNSDSPSLARPASASPPHGSLSLLPIRDTMPVAPPAAASRAFQLVLLTALAFRNSAMTLAVHHSRAVLKEPYSTLTTILCAELLKLGLSACLVFRERRHNVAATLDRLHHITLSSLHMAVPAILYLAQNQLNYVALRVLPSAQYSMIQQLKLLTTAVFCVLLLQKRIQPFQWRALLLLVVGVVLVQSSSSSLHAASSTLSDVRLGWWQSLLATPLVVYSGLGAALLQTVLCGLSGAYTEWRLKGDRSVSLWEQNWQLALHSLLFGLLALVGSDSDRRSVARAGFFHGYSAWTLLCILLNGLGGLLVSAILLYMDNILKNFSGTAAILLTSYISYFLFGEDIFSIDFMCGTATILLAMLTYTGQGTHTAATAATATANAKQLDDRSPTVVHAHHHTPLLNGGGSGGEGHSVLVRHGTMQL